MRFLSIIILFTFQQGVGQSLDFDITEANFTIQLPNEEWELASKGEGNMTSYIFKRNPITDSEGREIIPAIMIFIEDASKYEQDVTSYTLAKRLQFQGKGITVDNVMIHENEDYPISYKNSFFTMCSYTDNGLAHILYMIHIITEENKGIQIYMDMTKDLVNDYSGEFWSAMKSIKEKEKD